MRMVPASGLDSLVTECLRLIGHTVLSEERKARTLHALEQIDKSLAHEVFGDDEVSVRVRLYVMG